MPSNTLSFVKPTGFTNVGGFLGQRFHANSKGRLKDWALSEQFIRLHERKNYDDWFWMGEQVGKWLDAAAYTALLTDDDELLARVQEIIERLADSQEEDGYLGITHQHHRNPVRGMELYENYYVLLGLLVCAELLESDVALNTADRLGDYITKTWGVGPERFPLAGRYPGNGHDGGEGTLILEPIVRLGQMTGNDRYVAWGKETLNKWDDWFARYPESVHTCGWSAMKDYATGRKDVWELRQPLHAHTFHMTLLGVAALYNATGNEEYRQVVQGCVDRLAEDWIFLTGGMSSLERYVPRRNYHPNNQIEVCPQHTWILLLAQLLKWTGDSIYAAEIERDLYNHFLAAQLADGSNWSYFTPLNGRAREPSSPNCCNAAGHRIAGRMPVYLYGLLEDDPAVLIYAQSEATLRPSEGPAVTLRQETDYPSSGQVTIHVSPETPADFAVRLRIPSFAEGATLAVNGGQAIEVQGGDFAIVRQQWQAGDRIELDLPMPISAQVGDGQLAIVRGPLVYTYFQDAQTENGVFHQRRGLYPEDVALRLDLDDVAGSLAEEAAPESLLGPMLIAQTRRRAQAPIFATAAANAKLASAEKLPVRLLPFANQGTVRGVFATFLRYEE